ncbi:vacuolar membrane-associated protein iml1 [Ophidiomyces ophidiicola]|nr:vacuolar membrane-associated protein iml1 [Ophidiomyces ophidiicola]KAI1928614.1 vacuolar membrane-associated protein iml1 [Ophidiomyces ophidiicola]KAI1966284.1 vacuolar membrane-associated protein iml1 [Ophidiomyces ophidiicola]KAI1976403.1 vacuolar membrane-associated protein iml1 [Ophidiomyces ophidiicola]KAI2009636.1 vacuolar membrane-associated protein iml1 [Ophidiomyces ophidiicola]
MALHQSGSIKGLPPRQLHPTGAEPTLSRGTTAHFQDAKLESARAGSSHPSPRTPVPRTYTLWIHEETFSREDVLCNVQALGDVGFKVGQLVEVMPAHGEQLLSHRKSESAGTYFHDGAFFSRRSLGRGTSSLKFAYGRDPKRRISARFLFTIKPFPPEVKSRHPNLQISVSHTVANAFGFKNRMQVQISHRKPETCTASHVELIFRDQFLLRSDMWRLTMSDLVDRPIYKGQKILFMNSIKATVKSVYIRGKKSLSAYFSPNTIPIFRSESARFVLFIQMSKEMWDFDSEPTGDILFSRVINSMLPELFKRWARIDAHHLVTIVLFTRVQYDLEALASGPSALNSAFLNRSPDDSSPHTQDFYRVVVNDMPSGQWTTILDTLKQEFRVFLRDVSIPPPYFPETSIAAEDIPRFTDSFPPKIAGCPTSAVRGNILEAINVATSYLAFEHIGRDLVRTGTSIVIITPGTGVFEVPFKMLALTSDVLTSRAIGIDLICLSPMPLHSVPLFKYKLPRNTSHQHGGSISNRLHQNEHRRMSISLSTGRLSPLDRPGSAFSDQALESIGGTAEEDEWGYGIPHWVDISFWDPKLDRASRVASKKGSIALPAMATFSKRSQPFVPKVRLYEIQMMGVMESEQSSVSIPPMASSTRHQKRPNTMISLSTSLGHSPSPESSYRSHGGDGFRPKSYMYNIKESKKSMLPPQAKQRTNLIEWMDEYDHLIFHPKVQQQRQQRSVKRPKGKQITEVAESTTFKPPEIKRNRDVNERDGQYISPFSRPRIKYDRIDEEAPSPSTKMTVPSLIAERRSSIKPRPRLTVPRISRSISFALRGLGAAPPRAQARTEINAEHVQALPTTGGKTPEDATSEASAVDTPKTSSPLNSGATTPRFWNTVDNIAEDIEIMTPSKPISIKIARQVDDDSSIEPMHLDETFSSHTSEMRHDSLQHDSQGTLPVKRTGRRLDLLSNGESSATSTVSAADALSPWIRSVNPWNPPKHAPTRASWFGRWHHVYPRMPKTISVKWKSLKSPASLPLTTEELPSDAELTTNFLQSPYRVYQNEDPGYETPKTREMLLREMIALRLSHGFQIVVGKRVEDPSTGLVNIFDTKTLPKDGATIFMVRGNVIHRIVCAEGEIEVTKFSRRLLNGFPTDELDDASISYSPAVKTILSAQYCKNTIILGVPPEEYNWNLADAFIAGHRDHITNSIKQLRFWRTRFVLIPVQVPTNARMQISSYHEDNEEEIHLLGIYKLTQMWQRYRYVPPEVKRLKPATLKSKDENPLNIIYQTSDPSVVVAAELDRLLLEDPGLDNTPAQLLPDSELLTRSDITLSFLSQRIQSKKGVKLMDRRWHWRLHYNCFVGMEFTTWLLLNFRDIDSREEAVEFGNELMKHGLFNHVQRRHDFRDGNYFYQISDEFRIPRPESRGGWFQPRKTDKASPNTPVGEGKKQSPSSTYTRSDKSVDDLGKVDVTSNPRLNRPRPSVFLAKSLKYNVDPRNRSDRPEIIDLHYDRTHNPENCFHIELSWMNATPKLVEDAIMSWVGTAEKYGLKLVELPISEASSIVERQVFRRPYPIKLKVNPPEVNATTLPTATSFTSQAVPDRYLYQRAILKKFDFVLDFEAKDSFPPDVDVFYSWGRPSYQFPQYVHRSGAALAQITDEGHFLLLSNRFYNSHSPVNFKDPSRFDRSSEYFPRARAVTLDPLDRRSPLAPPVVRPIPGGDSLGIFSPPPPVPIKEGVRNSYYVTRQIKDEMRAFCSNVEKLEAFYAEVTASKSKPTAIPPSTSVKVSPTVPTTMDASIPSLELPASIVARNLHLPAPASLAPTKVTGEIPQVSGSIDAVVRSASISSPVQRASKR